MNRPTENVQSSLDSSPKRRRLHKRTVVVILFAVLPWILVAIPGTPAGDAGTTGRRTTKFVHGWPFVHLESIADELAARNNEGDPVVQFNLRLARDKDWHARKMQETGYWSNWSVWRIGTHFTPRYIGLLLNLICLTLLVSIVAVVCEFKIRRHQGLLRYSIANLLVGMALLAACIAWVVQMNRENAAQDSLRTLARDGGAVWGIENEFQGRFSLIFSQLLNHGKHLWGTVPISKQLKSGRIVVDLDQDSDLEELRLIAHCAKLTQHGVDLRVYNFNPETQSMLDVMGQAKVVLLYLDFDAKGQKDQKRKPSDFEVDLDFDMWDLEEIRLELDRTISQKEQLEQFLELPSLQWASVSGLSTQGAEYILKTKTKWPKVMGFGFQDDVSEGLREKLESEFDADGIDGS